MTELTDVGALVERLREDADYLENYVGFVGSQDRIIRNLLRASDALSAAPVAAQIDGDMVRAIQTLQDGADWISRKLSDASWKPTRASIEGARNNLQDFVRWFRARPASAAAPVEVVLETDALKAAKDAVTNHWPVEADLPDWIKDRPAYWKLHQKEIQQAIYDLGDETPIFLAATSLWTIGIMAPEFGSHAHSCILKSVALHAYEAALTAKLQSAHSSRAAVESQIIAWLRDPQIRGAKLSEAVDRLESAWADAADRIECGEHRGTT